MNAVTRRTSAGVLVVVAIAVASGVLGYWTGTQPFTEFGNLAVVFYGLVILGASLLLLVAALLVGLWRRRVGWPLLLTGIAGALLGPMTARSAGSKAYMTHSPCSSCSDGLPTDQPGGVAASSSS